MPPLGETMEIPLVVDERVLRWQLLKKMLKFSDLRKVKIVAKYTRVSRIRPIKVIITSIFFSTRISYVIKELKRRRDLGSFLE